MSPDQTDSDLFGFTEEEAEALAAALAAEPKVMVAPRVKRKAAQTPLQKEFSTLIAKVEKEQTLLEAWRR